jgi:hypothetical protein
MNHGDLATVSPLRAERFLWDLANLSDDAFEDFATKALTNFEKRYGDILPSQWNLAVRQKELNAAQEAATPGSLLSLIDPTTNATSPDLRNAVRHIWVSPDRRTREWQAFRLIDMAGIKGGYLPTDNNPRSKYDPMEAWWQCSDLIPPLTPLEHCLRHLISKGSKATVCQNKQCRSPYFFAIRKSQKYCSERCALPAQRAFKLAWWNRTGKQRRGRRRASDR